MLVASEWGGELGGWGRSRRERFLMYFLSFLNFEAWECIMYLII